MKRITAIALFTIASFATTAGAFAADHAVKANVPFDFTVGTTLLPAGTYTIAPVSTAAIKIENSDRHIALLSLALHDSNEVKDGKLVFARYGDKYFLSEILCPSALMSVSLPTSKLEKKARIQESRLYDSGQTLVAAK